MSEGNSPGELSQDVKKTLSEPWRRGRLENPTMGTLDTPWTSWVTGLLPLKIGVPPSNLLLPATGKRAHWVWWSTYLKNMGYFPVRNMSEIIRGYHSRPLDGLLSWSFWRSLDWYIAGGQAVVELEYVWQLFDSSFL